MLLYLATCLLFHYYASAANVHNFRTISWNSNGGRWDTVAELMNQRLPSNGQQARADVMAIQEAGSIRQLQGLREMRGEERATDYFTGEPSLIEVSKQYEWTHQATGQKLYLYYLELVETTGSKTPKQNLAIVTRNKVDGLHMMKQEIPSRCNVQTNPDCLYKYRPSLGVEMNGAYFYSVHPRPINTRNEAQELVDTILHQMAGNFRGKTWLVVGDFNREPTDLAVRDKEEVKSRLGGVVYTAVQRVVATAADKPTRAKRRLDYGVIGGPQNSNLNINVQRLKDVTRFNHVSDHEPVLFNF